MRGFWHRLTCLCLLATAALAARPVAQQVPVVQSVTADLPSGTPVGTPITWTVNASGGATPLQYQYWIADPSGWKLMQGYSVSNVFTWVPSKAGLYALCVYVRSAGSPAPWESFSRYVYFTVVAAPLHIDHVGPTLYAPVPLNQAITWRVRASGGSGATAFKYDIHDGTAWRTISDYSSSSVFTYTPSRPGRYALSVYARNAGSTAPYETFSPNIYFTVAGTGAPGVGALANYVDTGAAFDASMTCDASYPRAFTGARLPKEIDRLGTGPLQYNWDFAATRLRAELDLFGYRPQYTPGRVSFATNGRPVFRDNHLNAQILGDDGTWSRVSLFDAARVSLARQNIQWTPDSTGSYYIGDFESESRIVYDRNCHAYMVIDSVRASLTASGSAPQHRSILMHSIDGGRNWAAYPLPDAGVSGFDGDYQLNLELPTASHVLDGPPSVLIHPRWYDPATPHVLKLVTLTRLWDGTLQLSGPLLVSDRSLSGAGVAGFENYAVSAGDLIHIVYPGDALARDAYTGFDGTPAYAVTYSRRLGRMVGPPVQTGVAVTWYSETAVDDHNQPVIARDAQGYLHLAMTGHNGAIYYRRSAAPDDTTRWGPLEVVGFDPRTDRDAAKYSYTSMIIDRSNQPFVAARTSGIGYVFRLVAMRRNAATAAWEPEKTVLHPGRPYYGNWYNKLSLDPSGRAFLSYAYLPDNWFSDEVPVFANTYGLTMTLVPNPPCTPSTHLDAVNTRHCPYAGAHMVNFSVLAADLNRSWPDLQFDLATSGSFVGNGLQLWVDTTNVATGRSIVVAWSGVRSPTPTDWIGVFPAGASDRGYFDTVYTGNCARVATLASASAGRCTFSRLQPGTYEVRFYASDGYTPLAASRPFVVP